MTASILALSSDLCVCLCMCDWVSEGERERKKKRTETNIFLLFSLKIRKDAGKPIHSNHKHTYR